MVLVFLRPADQERPVAVQPGVAGFNDPAAGAPARREDLELDFLAAGADVWGEAAPDDELAHGLVVVTTVEAQTLRLLGRRAGPLDRDRVERRG